MNRSNLNNIPGVEIVGNGSRKAYFYGAIPIAMELQGVVSILPTDDEEVEVILNKMLLGTGYYINVRDDQSYLVDLDNQETEMGEAFCLRVKETL